MRLVCLYIVIILSGCNSDVWCNYDCVLVDDFLIHEDHRIEIPDGYDIIILGDSSHIAVDIIRDDYISILDINSGVIGPANSRIVRSNSDVVFVHAEWSGELSGWGQVVYNSDGVKMSIDCIGIYDDKILVVIDGIFYRIQDNMSIELYKPSDSFECLSITP